MSFNHEDYYLFNAEVSDNPAKKYTAVLRLRTDPYNEEKEIRVDFGDVNSDHYKDKTGLNAYPSKNKGKIKDKKTHIDNKKKGTELYKKFSETWLEKIYLY